MEQVQPLHPTDPTVVGEYRLLGRIGAGGMGTVYLASDAHGARVALKTLADGSNAGAEPRARLAREGRSLMAVNHPHVVRIIEVNASAEPPYLVMSYVPGWSLDRAVPPGGLPPAQVRKAGSQLAGALAAVHRHGIVHRDLKPSNVILGTSGITLVDFGIASLQQDSATALTRSGYVIGTLAWLAPEVIAGARADERSDVFGLGLLLGFLARGSHPYGEGRPESLMYRIMHEAPDLAGVDPQLASMIEVALHPDPDRRPTAAELTAWLLAPRTRSGPVPGSMRSAPRGGSAQPLGAGGSKRSAPRRVSARLLVGAAAAIIAGTAIAAGASGGTTARDASAAAVSTPQQEIATEAPEPAPDPVASSPAALESSDFTSTCTWAQRELTYAESIGPAYFSATCGPGSGISATAFDGGDKLVVEGTIGGAPFSLEAEWSELGLWRGTFNGRPVMMSTERDGNGFTVYDGSTIGQGAVRAVGPQAGINEAAFGPGEYFVWDNPSIVTGRFYGDANVTTAQAAALCQLLTVGLPASGIVFST